MRFSRLKLTAFAAACFLTSLVGCNVQEAVPSMLSQEGVSLELIREVEAIAEPQVQKIVFAQMLTSEEKNYIFKKRIIEKMEVLSLTGEQTDHLNLLLANMAPDMFNKNSASARKSTQFVDEWTKKGKAIFNQAVLKDIVASLAPSAGKTKASTNKTAPPKNTGANCNCASNSDWCSDGYACTYIPSCNGQGCGTMWIYTCSGECDIIVGGGY